MDFQVLQNHCYFLTSVPRGWLFVLGSRRSNPRKKGKPLEQSNTIVVRWSFQLEHPRSGTDWGKMLISSFIFTNIQSLLNYISRRHSFRVTFWYSHSNYSYVFYYYFEHFPFFVFPLNVPKLYDYLSWWEVSLYSL